MSWVLQKNGANACHPRNPHEIDGSGFFVAIFTKTAHRSFPVQIPSSRLMPEIPWRARNENNRYTVVSTDNSDVQSIATSLAFFIQTFLRHWDVWHTHNFLVTLLAPDFHCCLLLQRISFSSLEMKFYGLRDLPDPLVAEYNIKGKLTQLNLVNSALLQLLQSHLNCKGSPLFLEAGFKMFQVMWWNPMINPAQPDLGCKNHQRGLLLG